MTKTQPTNKGTKAMTTEELKAVLPDLQKACIDAADEGGNADLMWKLYDHVKRESEGGSNARRR